MLSFFRFVTPLLATCALAIGCGGEAPAASTSATSRATAAATQAAGEPTQAAGDPTPGTSLNGCELVTATDVEAALDLDAGTVDEGALELQPTVLDPATNECRYDGDWGGLVVRVTPTDGVNTFDAVKSSFGDDAEELTGIGDGALWFEDNNRGYFLKGAVHVLLQFTHITSGMDSFRDPTVAVGKAAIAKI